MPARWPGVLSLLLIAGLAFAQSAPVSTLDARLKRLELELRCLVCQNQTLADSSAPLAVDLRREVRELAVAGKSDDDIRAFLTARYGDFVLYNPPVQRNTWLLWFGPFLLLAGGAVIWWRIGHRATDGLAAADGSPSGDDAAARGQALLK
jgi:cytochrome c-type biogenesis protein CcmH